MTTEQFINRYKLAAIRTHLFYSVPASVTLAQAILESASGNSSLATLYNNYFGIKGGGVTLPTHEYVNGQLIVKNDSFKTYPNAYSSFKDHAKFLNENNRYNDAFLTNDSLSFAKEISSAGYATAPNYYSSLENIIKKYNLTKYDIYGQNKALFFFLLLFVILVVFYLFNQYFKVIK